MSIMITRGTEGWYLKIVIKLLPLPKSALKSKVCWRCCYWLDKNGICVNKDCPKVNHIFLIWRLLFCQT